MRRESPGIDALLGAASEHGGLLFGDSGDEGFGLVDAGDPINPPPAKKTKAPGVYVGIVVVGRGVLVGEEALMGYRVLCAPTP